MKVIRGYVDTSGTVAVFLTVSHKQVGDSGNERTKCLNFTININYEH